MADVREGDGGLERWLTTLLFVDSALLLDQSWKNLETCFLPGNYGWWSSWIFEKSCWLRVDWRDCRRVEVSKSNCASWAR